MKETMVNKNFEELKEMILDWADNENLLHSKNTDIQFMEFIEKVFDFKSDMDGYNFNADNSERFFYWQMKRSMGNVFASLIILCKQLGIEPEECLSKVCMKINNKKLSTNNKEF